MRYSGRWAAALLAGGVAVMPARAMAQSISSGTAGVGVQSIFSQGSSSRTVPTGIPSLPVTLNAINCLGAGCATLNRTLLMAFNATYSVPSGNACVSATGNDATGIVYSGSIPSSSPSCFATLQTCLNSAAGTCQINGAGDFAPPHFRYDIDAGGTSPKIIKAQTPLLPRIRVPGNNALTTTWTQSATYPNLWSMPVSSSNSGVLRVMYSAQWDKYGFENRLTMYGLTSGKPWTSASPSAVTSALVSANAATNGVVYDPNNALLYVGLGGLNVARVAANGGIRPCWLDSTGYSSIFILGANLYVSGVTLDCVAINTFTGGTSGSPIYSHIYAENFRLGFGGGDARNDAGIGVQAGAAYIANANIAGAYDDNIHCDADQYSNRAFVAVFNSGMYEAGDTQSFVNAGSNSTPQPISAHGGCDIVGFGLTVAGTATGWQNIGDTSYTGMTAYSWYVGVLSYDAPAVGLECSGNTSGTRTCWYDNVMDLSAGAHGMWGTGTGITLKTATVSGISTAFSTVTCDTGATCATYDIGAP